MMKKGESLFCSHEEKPKSKKTTQKNYDTAGDDDVDHEGIKKMMFVDNVTHKNNLCS